MAVGQADHEIPVIDLSSSNASEEILAAGMKHGFIFINQAGSGLSQDAIDGMFQISKLFFAAPESVKSKAGLTVDRGWIPMHTETLDPAKQKRGDFKEAFNIAEFVDGRAQQVLSGPLEENKKTINAFMESCHHVCRSALTLLAAALNIPDDQGGKEWFAERHDRSKGPSSTVLRLLYYPSVPATANLDTELDIRAGAHSDYGSVTLLFRLPGQPGLEILTRSGAWAPVPVDPEPSSEAKTLPILLNIGDLLSFWTGGLLKSTVHRVIFPRPGEGVQGGEDRYSIAYFCHPLHDVRLVNVPSPLIESKTVANGRQVGPEDGILTAQDHLHSRLAATYHVK